MGKEVFQTDLLVTVMCMIVDGSRKFRSEADRPVVGVAGIGAAAGGIKDAGFAGGGLVGFLQALDQRLILRDIKRIYTVWNRGFKPKGCRCFGCGLKNPLIIFRDRITDIHRSMGCRFTDFQNPKVQRKLSGRFIGKRNAEARSFGLYANVPVKEGKKRARFLC